MIAEKLSFAPEFWKAYRSWRLRIITQPFTVAENALVQQTAAALEDHLCLSPVAAGQQARRSILFRRERLLHETLLLDLVPSRLNELLDGLEVAGLAELPEPRQAAGVLLAAPHYSLFSSLLCLWLARAARRGRLSHLSILIDTGPSPRVGISTDRIIALELGDLCHRDCTTLELLNGPVATMRTLSKRLRTGGTVLIFADTKIVPAQTPQKPTLNFGRHVILLPTSIPWLASRTGCTVVTAHMQPSEDTHKIVFSAADSGASPDLKALVQQLIDRTILRDPAPWEGWERFIKRVPAERRSASFERTSDAGVPLIVG